MATLHLSQRQKERREEEKPPEVAELEVRFQAEMVEMYREARTRCHHDHELFARLVSKRGGVTAAKRLINTCKPSDEFLLLKQCGSLNRTVEALILQERFRPLFTEAERRKAEKRLREHGQAPEASS